MAELPLGLEGADFAAYAWLQFLGAGKFISIYAFLFGMGFQQILDRSWKAGKNAWGVGMRRLVFLAVLGVLHVVLLWCGDMLLAYALFGLVLLVLHRVPAGVMGVLSAVCMGVGLLFYAGLAAVAWSAGGLEASSEPGWFAARTMRAMEVYAQGTWQEVMLHRIGDGVLGLVLLFFWAPQLVALMLAGAWVSKTGGLFRSRGAWIGLGVAAWVVGLPANAWTALWEVDRLPASAAVDAVSTVLSAVSPQLLAAAYLVVVLVAAERSWGRGFCRFFAAPGRMPLSNYLFQSLAATWIFNGYGLGLYGRVGPLAACGIALGIFGVQAAASLWWMARHGQGPLEALWKRFTYGRPTNPAENGGRDPSNKS